LRGYAANSATITLRRTARSENMLHFGIMKSFLPLALCAVFGGTAVLHARTTATIDYTTYTVDTMPRSVLMTLHAGPLTRGFAWQTTTSVTAGHVWLLEGTHGAADAAAFLAEGTRFTGTRSTVSAPDANCHRIAVTGLAYGKTYSYRLGAGDAHDVYGSFTVRPADDALTVLTFSDAQTKDYAKLYTWENTVSRAAELVGAANLDFVLYAGDLYDENAPALKPRKYRQWGIGVDTATPYLPGVPWVFASGNHDYTVYADTTAVDWRMTTPYAGCHAFDRGNVHVATLPYLGGWNAAYETALDWLDADLAAASNATWKIVALHWGPYVTGDHYMDVAGTKDLIRKMTPICAARHVDLVLQAHDHVFTKTLPYRWNAAGYTTAAQDAAVVNLSPATRTLDGTRWDDNPAGTYYVSCGSAGHRVGENPLYAEASDNPKSYVNGTYKIATDTMDVDSAWGRAGDNASHDLSASMFGVLRVTGDRLAYDFYVVSTNGLAAPVLYDTLRIHKGPAGETADTFRVTPYVQRPATNAMSVLWLTETNAPAVLRCWPAAGGDVRRATTTPEYCRELAYSAKDVSDYNARQKSWSGPQAGPLLSLPWQHRVRLTGLAPATRYTYVVELAGGTAYTNTFRTAPGRDTPVRFIAYSDCETEPESTGKCDGYWTDPVTGKSANYYVDQTTGFASNIVRMVERDPDFILIAGDLAQYGTEQRDWDEFWRHQAGLYNDPAGSIPLLAAPGNHDVINSDHGETGTDGGTIGMARWSRYFEFNPNGVSFPSVTWQGRTYSYDRSELFHRLDYGCVTVICMDSNNGDDSDPERDSCLKLFAAGNATCQPAISPDFNPGSPQFTWITNQLADAHAQGQFIFVACHHMPYSVGYHCRTNGVAYSGYVEPYSARALRVLTPYMLKYGVTAWIAGHDEIMEHSRVFGRDVAASGVPGIAPDAELNLYDVGNSGDGLRGGGTGTAANPYLCGEANPFEVFRAEVDAPPVLDAENVLTDGARHYGHLEINVRTNAQGRWQCTLTPVYVFVSKDANGVCGPFARRVYNDVITIDDRGRRVMTRTSTLIIR